MAQITTLSEELTLVKAEIVNVKSSHATMHQQSVDKNVMDGARFAEAATKINELTERIDQVSADARNPFAPSTATHAKPLLEPKQVQVDVFAGAVVDSRAKFLEWCEKVHDRVALTDPAIVEAMTKAENEDEPISSTRSGTLGVNTAYSKQLHGFLKNWTSGTAASIVRNNTGGIGLES